MKRLLPKTLWVVCLLALLWPASGFGDQLPLEKKVAPGISFVTYQGQTLRFVTPVNLSVSIESVSTSVIHLKFLAPGTVGSRTTSAETRVAVYWVNFGTDVYNGAPPVGQAWEGDLNTEGGFVDR